jgi:hypothetical protein
MLFIGNSFTTKNDLPTLLSDIAQAGKGITIESKVISAGGASLRRHWNAGAATTITSEKWNHVVLQEQSTLPVKNSNRFHENVREFVPAMKESGAKMVLFMTWARKKEPENQGLLTDSYNQIGKELEASVVPVGTAWQKFLPNTTNRCYTLKMAVIQLSPGHTWQRALFTLLCSAEILRRSKLTSAM